MLPKQIGTAQNPTTGKWYKIIMYTDSDETPFYNVFPESTTHDDINKAPFSGYYNLYALLRLKGLIYAPLNL